MISFDDLKLFGLSLLLAVSLPIQIIYMAVMLIPSIIKFLINIVYDYLNY